MVHPDVKYIIIIIMTQLRKWVLSIGFKGLDRWPLEVPGAIARMNVREVPDCDLPPSEIMLG